MFKYLGKDWYINIYRNNLIGFVMVVTKADASVSMSNLILQGIQSH